ncbi:MAG: hypothetical protein Q7J06_11230 [Bacteroidales bacterium]|nr:hypothetical protein [Bacteroidales bacterium]
MRALPPMRDKLSDLLKSNYLRMKSNVENLKGTSSFLMRLMALTFMAVLFILPVKLNAQGAKSDFSGSWAFNESKSNLGEGRGFRSATQMTVKQDGNNLTVDRVRNNRDGEAITTTEKYTLDGKESVNTSGMGSAKTIVKWSADGKELSFAITRTFERNGETREMKSTEVWTMSDAKTLSVLSTSVFQDNERKTTSVYDKK